MHGISKHAWNLTRKIYRKPKFFLFCPSQASTLECPILRTHAHHFIKRECVCRKSKTYWIIYRSVSVLITLITDCANRCQREGREKERYSYNINRQAKGQCLINEWNIQDQIVCAARSQKVLYSFKIVINIQNPCVEKKEGIRRMRKKHIHEIHGSEMRNANL